MRIAWVDNAKAIGLLLVLIGHTAIMPGTYVCSLIYSFHMPLFFFLSGFLLRPEQTRLPLRSWVGRLARALLAPYAAFWLLSYLYWLPTHRFGSTAAEQAELAWWQPIVGALYGIAETLPVNPPLWFFTCLFTTALYFAVLARLLQPTRLALCVVLLGIAGPLWRIDVWKRPPWNTDLATVTLVFYAAGHFLRRSGRLDRARPGLTAARLAALPALAAVLWWKVDPANWTDLSKMRLGNDVWGWYLAAFAGTGLAVAAALLLPPSRAARWLADNTVILFPLHPILYGIFTGIGVVVFRQPFSFKNNLPFAVLYVLGALAVGLPVCRWLRRYAPELIGQTRRAPPAGA